MTRKLAPFAAFSLAVVALATGTVAQAQVPNAPTNFTAAAGDAQATLSWDNPNDSTITKYQLRYGAGSSVPATANWADITGSTAATINHTVMNLTNGTQYAFEIRAVNATGDSDASDTVTATPTQPRTLTYTFSDNGTAVTIAASGSLDVSDFQFVQDDVPSDVTNIRMDDTDIWGIHPPNRIAIKRYSSLPEFVTTGESSYGGTTELSNMANYSSNYHIRFSTHFKLLQLDSANLTGSIYEITNGTATFDGNLKDSLGDNDFDIEFAIGDQKIVFQTANPATVPVAPTSLAATARDTQVDLTWSDPSDTNITKYQVRYGAGATVPDSATWADIADSTAAATNHTVMDLTNGTQYAFEIRAVNVRGNSSASNTVTATPASVPALAAPTGLSATAGNAQITLNWDNPNNSSITKYQLRYGAGSSVPTTATWADITGSGAATTSHTVTGLTNGTQYAFEIRAMTAGSTGPASEEVVLRAGPPLQPSGFRVVGGNAEVTLSWNDPSDTTITKYQLRHKVGSSFSDSDTWSDIADSGPTTTTHTVTELTNGTTWAFQIRAANASGAGPASETLTMLPRANNRAPVLGGAVFGRDGLILPSGYRNVRLTKGFGPRFSDPDGDDLTFTWTANPEQTNLDVQIVTGFSTIYPDAHYLRYRAAGTVERTTLTVTGTDPYGLSVSTSAVVTTINTTPKTKSPPYPDQTLAVGNTLTVNLTDMFVDDEGDDIRLLYRTPDDGDNVDTRAISWGAFRVIAHTPGEEVISVTVEDFFGAEGSDSFKVTVIAAAAAPAGLTATSGNGQAVLTWTDPGDSGITKYQLRHKVGTSFSDGDDSLWADIAGSGASTTSHTVTGLTNGTEYVFQVRAVNAGGPGPASEVVLRLGAPLQPGGFRVVGGNAEVTLSWNDPSDTTITKYQLRHKVGTSFSDSDTWSDIADSGPTTTTHTVTELTNGTTWAFQIRAVNASGAGPASETLTMLPRANNRAPVFQGSVFGRDAVILPSRYRNVRLTKGFGARFSDPDGDELTFTWTANPEQTNLDVQIVTGFTTTYPDAHYLRYRAAGTVERTTMTVTGTDPYGLSVSTSAVVTTINTTPKAKSPPYPDQTLAVGNTLTVNLTDMFVDDEGDDIRLLYRTPDDGDNVDTRAISWGAFRVIAHTPGEEVISVTVEDSFGAEGSDSFKVTVIAAAAAPAGLTATSGNGQAVLTWIDPGDSGITKYQLRHKAGTSFSDGDDSLWADIADSDASTTSHTVTGLTNGTEYVFQVRAVNAGGSGTASVAVTATANNATPSFDMNTVDDQSYTQNSAITTLNLPAATGGDGTLTYSLSPDAPDGLAFSAAERTLSGTPTGSQAATAYTYTATDADGDAVSLTFNITIIMDEMPNFGTNTVDDQSYTQDSAITMLNLPAATGGNGTLTYSLSPDAPDGLAFSAAERTLSGTPTGSQAATAYTYTATDADGDAVSLTFNITIVMDEMPNFGTNTVDDQSYTQDSAITMLTLPAATGGNGTLTYSLSPDAPGGLAFSAAERTLSGTPTGTQAATAYTYTATDADGDAVSLTFNITIMMDEMPDFGTNTVDDQSYTQNSAITVLNLPAAAGGNGTLTYSLSPDAPDGLAFSAAERTLSGTPTGSQAATAYTYTATDADGDAVSLTFNITIVMDEMPNFGANTIDNQSYTQDSAITTLNLPAATGGDGTLTYSLSPDAPDGLAFSAAERTLSGTPTATQMATTYTYTATDADGDAVSLTFNITIVMDEMPDFGANTVDDQSYTQNSAITTLNLPAATDGNGTLTYSLSPDAPDGLAFSAAERTLSGTPTGTQAATAYTYTATDADGDAVSLTFNITIVMDEMPDFGANTIDDQSYTQNTAITMLNLPAATGGNGALTYSLSPDAPDGLAFSAAERTLSGTPTGSQAATAYTYTATDADGDAVSLTFNITIVADKMPDFGTNTIDDQSYTQNSAITTLNLPAATDGDGTLTYSLSPDAPDGLAFSAAERTLSGTPTATQMATTYTYTATDADGDAVSLTFNITIVMDEMPDFGANTVDDQSYTQNSAITTLNLPAATDGNGTLTYSLSPDAPDGLAFSAAERTLSGTPTGSQAATAYTYTATDADGDAVSLTFNITIVMDEMPDFGANTIDNQSYTQDSAITALNLPAATGGNGTLTYSLSPDAPDGLAFSAAERTLSGTPTGSQAATAYTYTATDADGDAVSLTFNITIVMDEMPDFGANTIDNQSYTQDSAITTLNLPAATDGNGTLTYSLSPDAPDGLAFSAAERTLSGTPTGTQMATAYTYTATDADGDAVSLTFNITIVMDEMPDFGANTIDDQSYTQNTAITMLNLPAGTGGNGTLTYSLSPGAPDGLAFSAAERTLSGTPTGSQAATAYTYTATDADGDAVSLTFNITIVMDEMPDFGTNTVDDQGYTQNRTITTLNLPAATGGNGALTYSLSPDAPDGLAFSAAERTLSGTPTGIQAVTAYTYTATDADGDTVSLTFNIEVTTVEMERQALKPMLAAAARATLTGAVDVIGQRFDAVPGGPNLSLAGRRIGGTLPVVDDHRLDRRDDRATPVDYSVRGSSLLRGSAFTLPLAASGEASDNPGWTVWGRGDWRAFEGRKDGNSWDGEQWTGWLGVDARPGGRLMAGLALSHSESETDYRQDESGGRLETSLTTVWPYVQVTTGNGSTLRTVLGRGEGEAEHRTPDGNTEKADLSLLAGSVSGRLPVARQGGFSWSAVGGVSLARIKTDGSSATAIGDLKATNWRLKGGAEATHDGLALSSGSNWLLKPRGALTVRKDGGDGVTGVGVELSGGAHLTSPGSRFDLDASGHWLALHSEDGTREWGASLEARLNPAAGGHGLSLALVSALGPQQDGTLAKERPFDAERNAAPQRLSLTAHTGYGVATTSGGLLTPFAELTFSGGSRSQHYRTGIGFVRNGIDAALTVGHRAGGERNTRIGVDLRLNF